MFNRLVRGGPFALTEVVPKLYSAYALIDMPLIDTFFGGGFVIPLIVTII